MEVTSHTRRAAPSRRARVPQPWAEVSPQNTVLPSLSSKHQGLPATTHVRTAPFEQINYTDYCL